MKKWIFICLAVVAVATATFAIIRLCNRDSAEQELPQTKVEENLMVAYINIDQLATKGAFTEHIDTNRRKFFATMASSAITESALADHAANIITDLSTTGLNLTRPAYATINEDGNGMVVVEVADVANLDKSIELLSLIAEEDGGVPIVVERSGSNRLFALDNETIAGYNDTHLVIAMHEDVATTKECVIDALKRPIRDFSIFGSSDLAFYVNCHKGIAIMRDMLNNTKDEYELLAKDNSYYEDNIIEIEQTLALVDSYAAYFEEDANAIISLTFELGQIMLNATINGMNTDEYNDIMRRTNNKHLEYIDEDAAIVANIGINGKRYAEVLDSMLKSKYFQESEYNTLEVNMIAGIACDAIKSIDGDLTLAVEDIEGRYESYYDSFYEEQLTNAVFRSIDLSAIIDVTDSYIISNIGMFAGGLLHRKDSNHYYGSFSGFDISLGQDDNVFHAGINTTYDIKDNSVANADWLPLVENSLSYVVVDVENLMDYSYMEALNKMFLSYMEPMEQNIYSQYVDMCDYIYLTQPDLTEAELVIVLKDKETNALKQVADVIMPLLASQIIQNM